jgi:streptogramin lyase
MVLMVLAGCSKSTFTTLAVTSSSTPGFTITPTPTASEITSPVTSQPEKAGPNSEAIFAITNGPDGNLWFTETTGNKIG